jgi:hypothetical protein
MAYGDEHFVERFFIGMRDEVIGEEQVPIGMGGLEKSVGGEIQTCDCSRGGLDNDVLHGHKKKSINKNKVTKNTVVFF